MKVAIAANSAWYLYNFRRSLMRAMEDAGHDVVAISPSDDYAERLLAEGVRHRSVPLAAAGTNPFVESRTLASLAKLLKSERVEVAFTYTPKVNIYAGLAARMLKLTHVPNVSGLGRVFAQRSLMTPVVTQLYRLAFSKARRVVFQNEDDRSMFVRSGLSAPLSSIRVPGSGVDLAHFSPAAELPARTDVSFLLVARMLWDKGIGDFAAAARRLKAEGLPARFGLIGPTDAGDPKSVSLEQIQAWVYEGLLTYHGHADDVRPYLAEADCVVLPSRYREGVPRSLLEAAAMGRPLITTDAPGCRDTVDVGINGLLCLPGDVDSLAAAMRRIVEIPAEARAQMGRYSRQKAEQQFDEQIVLRTYLDLLAGLSGAQRPSRP